MFKGLSLLLFLPLTAGLACNIPSKDEQILVVRSVSVSPTSGNGSFTGTVVYTPGVTLEYVMCNYRNLRTNVTAKDFSKTIAVPPDKTLTFQETQTSFNFTVTQPGKYRLICARTAVLDFGNYAGDGTADFTVVAANNPSTGGNIQFPKWGDFKTADLAIDYKNATSSRAGIDSGHGCWPLHYWADDSSTFNVTSTGALNGTCHYKAVIQNNTEEMQGVLTGYWDEISGEVNFTLKTTHTLTATDNSSILIYMNAIEGEGQFTASQIASGTANWTTTLECQISELCAKVDTSPVTGTVSWTIEFRP